MTYLGSPVPENNHDKPYRQQHAQRLHAKNNRPKDHIVSHETRRVVETRRAAFATRSAIEVAVIVVIVIAIRGRRPRELDQGTVEVFVGGGEVGEVEALFAVALVRSTGEPSAGHRHALQEWRKR